MTEQERNLLKQAIYQYGDKVQLIKTVEEMGELIQAIGKYLLMATTNTRANLIEELADVEIMLDQLKLIFDEKQVEEMRMKKLQRLEAFIEAKSLNIQ